MEAKVSKKILPLLALFPGLVAWGLRRRLYALALDDRGLLMPGHPLETALWVLTALTLAFLFWSVWKWESGRSFEASFPPSFAGCAGQILFGAGILLTVLLEMPRTENLGNLWRLLGYLSFPALMAAGFCRAQGKTPFFMLHLIPCLFLIIHIIDHYRAWSSDPQLMDYVFSLFACLSLMLFAFYQASHDAGLPHQRMMTAVGLGTIYLNTVSLGAESGMFLSLGAIAWAGTGLCAPAPVRKENQG